jgi:hypothetical protein
MAGEAPRLHHDGLLIANLDVTPCQKENELSILPQFGEIEPPIPLTAECVTKGDALENCCRHRSVAHFCARGAVQPLHNSGIAKPVYI